MALAGKYGKKKYNPNITCFRCGEKGHIGWQCRKKAKDGKGSKGGKHREMTEANAVADEEFAFCGDCGDDTTLIVLLDSWLADSVCTSHIVWDHEIFINYTPTPGHQISGLGRHLDLGEAPSGWKVLWGGRPRPSHSRTLYTHLTHCLILS
jgi:hypothetical protein